MDVNWDTLGEPFACPSCGGTEWVPQWREGTTAEKAKGWHRLPVFAPSEATCATCASTISFA